MTVRGGRSRADAGSGDSRGSRGGSSGRGTRAVAPVPTSTLSVSEMYRGHARLALIRDLALGEFSHAEIAKSIGPAIQVADVDDFARDFAFEITEVRAQLAGQVKDECAGLWIAKRANRVAELQDSYDDCRIVVDQMRGNNIPGQDIGSKRHQNLLRAQLNILKAVAEELEPRRSGPGRPGGSGEDEDDRNIVHYIIEAPPQTTEALT